MEVRVVHESRLQHSGLQSDGSGHGTQRELYRTSAGVVRDKRAGDVFL